MINDKKVITIIMHNNLDGFLEVSSHNWNGKIFKVPISIVNEYHNNDLSCLGIYFLVSKNNDNKDFLYIGESENVLYALNRHVQNCENDKKSFYWNYAFILTWDDLDKSSIMYIKKKFYYHFNKSNIWQIFYEDNTNNTKLSRDREISCNEYIDISINILQSLGLIIIDKFREKAANDKKISRRDRIIKNPHEWYNFCYEKKSIIRNNDKFTIDLFYEIFKLLFVEKNTHKEICDQLSIYDSHGFVINIIINSLYLNKENHHEFFKKKIIFTLDEYNIFFEKNKKYFEHVIEVMNLLISNKYIKKIDFERFINEKNNV